MKEVIVNSAFFGAVISLIAYYIGVLLKRRFKVALANPLLVAIVITIGVLLVLDIDYQSYYAGAKYLNWLLTPATVCLAIPLYQQLQLLKRNMKAILLGILAGVLTSLCCVLVMALLFGLDHAQYVTLLPKSVTTAIGMGVAEELGGYPSIAAVVIILTGVVGNIFAEGFLRLLRIRESVARGIAIGTSSHALGTTKALELGETEGAMSSLSLVVAGLMTVVGASVFAQFM
ncbi:MAG: LrgB family protein [Clostridia bacterium]|nr:LrgB family protein [Clostridia bacterium]MBP3652531.1 LrgB family protein [Clostridia bacterium]